MKDSNRDWPSEFKEVVISPHIEGESQSAYFYKSTSKKAKPLIVSLHSWSGDYTQADRLALLSKDKNINYIHPDFQGPNNHQDACCSSKVIDNIESAIKFAIAEAQVDTAKIYVVGASGGGYTALCMYMKSQLPVAKFSAWASITDLEQWYYESLERNNSYHKDIIDCTGQTSNRLDSRAARLRSPLFFPSDTHTSKASKLYLYAGIEDGTTGSVPYIHSINFYNKLLADRQVTDSSRYVRKQEITNLSSREKLPANLGQIGQREIFLFRSHENIELTIFEGGHEILSEYALDKLLESPDSP
ncbi:prolyl oligopeptidase family serine peptidase [Zeaxanthinibacter sp. PT1]|uniref:alpha/beta hydrolase family protein n=1 Tax=Zeaxanthinibacter TaxID=561554 RepID=UPI00234A3265|nr:prolyl oligopeptidase family serine peptidase [Zeaxanthinibacter sp. PT1]MDC6352782.1 prolyl oligopeptidase family serine peptidase [Zeaxanthinibacter sp. PT1]